MFRGNRVPLDFVNSFGRSRETEGRDDHFASQLNDSNGACYYASFLQQIILGSTLQCTGIRTYITGTAFKFSDPDDNYYVCVFSQVRNTDCDNLRLIASESRLSHPANDYAEVRAFSCSTRGGFRFVKIKRRLICEIRLECSACDCRIS